MGVYIDGELVHTINQYAALASWKNRWNSAPVTPGLHTVHLVHASGAINDLDAVIITDSTATATPTATPTETPTGTVTLPVTPALRHSHCLFRVSATTQVCRYRGGRPCTALR